MDRELTNCFDVIQEECAEVISIISKIKRFGLDSYHPNDIDKVKNFTLLACEFGDLMGAFDKLTYMFSDEVSESFLDTAQSCRECKPAKIERFFRCTQRIEGIE